MMKLFTKARSASSIFFTDDRNFIYPSTVRDYRDVSDEGYIQCSEVYACVNLIARTAKGVKWLVYDKTKKGKKLVEIEDLNAPLVKLITAPNPYQSWATFLENYICYYLIAGNTYMLRRGPSATKPPSELWLLRPDRITVIPSKKASAGPIARYDYKVGDDDPVKLEPDRNIGLVPWHVLHHMKMLNPLDDLYGLSPIRASARVVDQMNEAAKLNYKLLKNGARPSGAFIAKGILPEGTEDSLKRQLVEQYSGAENAGKQLLLSGDLDWKQMGLSSKDMDWIEGQKMSTRRICSAYGVAPELIGDVQNKTYNNQKEARRALYLEAVMPLLDEIQDNLNLWLTPLFGDTLKLAYDKDDIEVIKDERAAVWGRVIQAVAGGIITQNEGRDAIGYEAYKDPKADKLLDPVKAPIPGNSNSTVDASTS